MPNQPKTPGRSVRISDDLWEAAKDVAAEQEETVTEVIVRSLTSYVAMHSPPTTETADIRRTQAS